MPSGIERLHFLFRCHVVKENAHTGNQQLVFFVNRLTGNRAKFLFNLARYGELMVRFKDQRWSRLLTKLYLIDNKRFKLLDRTLTGKVNRSLTKLNRVSDLALVVTINDAFNARVLLSHCGRVGDE